MITERMGHRLLALDPCLTSDLPAGLRGLQRRQERCYDAAMSLALEHKDTLVYMEGVVVFKYQGTFTPLGHGWTCTLDGLIADPTMPHIQGRRDIVYLGVPIKTEYSLWWRQHTGYFGALDGYPDGTVGDIYVDHESLWLDERLRNRIHK